MKIKYVIGLQTKYYECKEILATKFHFNTKFGIRVIVSSWGGYVDDNYPEDKIMFFNSRKLARKFKSEFCNGPDKKAEIFKVEVDDRDTIINWLKRNP